MGIGRRMRRAAKAKSAKVMGQNHPVQGFDEATVGMHAAVAHRLGDLLLLAMDIAAEKDLGFPSGERGLRALRCRTEEGVSTLSYSGTDLLRFWEVQDQSEDAGPDDAPLLQFVSTLYVEEL